MADYDSITISNYFRVKDKKALKELIGRTHTDWGKIQIIEQNGRDELYCISCLGNITGLREAVNFSEDRCAECSENNCNNCAYTDPCEQCDGENCGECLYECEYNYDAFIVSLMELLPDNEAVIISNVGHEKMDYIAGSVTVITNSNYDSTSLSATGLQLAQRLLCNPNWKTNNCRCK